MFKWLCNLVAGEKTFTYRSKRGIKLIGRDSGSPFTIPRVGIDWDDPQTREIIREQLNKWSEWTIEDGELVRRKDDSNT